MTPSGWSVSSGGLPSRGGGRPPGSRRIREGTHRGGRRPTPLPHRRRVRRVRRGMSSPATMHTARPRSTPPWM